MRWRWGVGRRGRSRHRGCDDENRAGASVTSGGSLRKRSGPLPRALLVRSRPRARRARAVLRCDARARDDASARSALAASRADRLALRAS
ncbi:hypothetical protein DB32_008694 [Sandaracinus amylolyticus]|uniref:Uncharacterized protein n=1 Tax=Sandaracinus amylolyticus TaxID=927083 RepID=A0A0F6YN56_9BACT|nr:hypothetical protein DB32_008694 [Sandaracinus amylolyticus]